MRLVLRSRLLTFFFEPHKQYDSLLFNEDQCKRFSISFLRFKKNFYDSVYQWEIFLKFASFNTGFLWGVIITSVRPKILNRIGLEHCGSLKEVVEI